MTPPPAPAALRREIAMLRRFAEGWMRLSRALPVGGGWARVRAHTCLYALHDLRADHKHGLCNAVEAGGGCDFALRAEACVAAARANHHRAQVFAARPPLRAFYLRQAEIGYVGAREMRALADFAAAPGYALGPIPGDPPRDPATGRVRRFNDDGQTLH